LISACSTAGFGFSFILTSTFGTSSSSDSDFEDGGLRFDAGFLICFESFLGIGFFAGYF
jgi:hypothetical protein